MTDARRIIHVPRRFVFDEWGGTETVLAALVEQQRRHGWQPEIHTSRALSSKSAESWRGVPIRRYAYCYPFFGLSAAQRHQLDKKGGNLLSLPLYFSLRGAKDVRLFHAHSIKRLGGAVLSAARRQRKAVHRDAPWRELRRAGGGATRNGGPAGRKVRVG